MAARALSLPDLQAANPGPALPDALEPQETSAMEQEIQRVDRMIEDMEDKVNVLRWTVEPRGGPEVADPLSGSDSVSVALLSMDEGEGPERGGGTPRKHVFIGLLLCGAVLVVATLSICVVFFS